MPPALCAPQSRADRASELAKRRRNAYAVARFQKYGSISPLIHAAWFPFETGLRRHGAFLLPLAAFQQKGLRPWQHAAACETGSLPAQQTTFANGIAKGYGTPVSIQLRPCCDPVAGMIAWKDGASALTTGMCAHSRQSSLKVTML